jgi:hypothetical protein
MKLKLIRTDKTEISTIGELFVNDKFECFILEDKDRGLTSNMELDEIKEDKVTAKTAIPKGTYTIAITYSNRFKQYLPILMNVPCFEGIRIHSGNTADHTEGCLLPGNARTKDKVLDSRNAFKSLFAKLKAVEKTEKITIEIC